MSITRKEACAAANVAFYKGANHQFTTWSVFEQIWCMAVEWAQSEAIAAPVDYTTGIEPGIRTMHADGYGELADVLHRAFQQSSSGKGKERHAGPNNLPFVQQPIMKIAERRGIGFLLGQADKKSEEALGLPPGRDVAEILGAIVYLSAAVIFIEKNRKPANDNDGGTNFSGCFINNG